MPGLIEPADYQPTALNRPLLVHVAKAEHYVQAHIEGAHLVEPHELVSGEPPATGRLPEKERLEGLFTRLAFSADRDVVLYDDEGGGWAGRMAWTLDVIGHENWYYLNGGIHAWHAEGLALVAGPDDNPPGTEPVQLTIHTGPIAEIEDVLATIDDDNRVVWDVRSREEYEGLRQAAARSGHIPGAINYDWLLLQDTERALRLPTDLASTLADLNLTPDKEIITHCQTHHRSGLSYMVARLLNYPNIRAYHGSWSEWGNRDDTPIER